MFTSLHSALGLPAGPITDDMITQAVENDIPESEDLDFKQSLPSKESLVQSDVKKDLAAMANYGGGVIIYGVTDSDSRAGTRLDTGAVDDNYTQAYQRVAYNHITPPLHNVEIVPLVSDDGTHAVAVIVPASQQVPHMLIGKDKKFNVPIRHGADTDWLPESEIARLYQQRFNVARRRHELLLEHYERTRELARPSGFWAVGVARPVTRTVTAPMESQDVSQFANRLVNQKVNLWDYSKLETPFGAYHGNVYPRRGFRSWRYLLLSKESGHPESYLAFHDDGAVSALVNLPAQEEGSSVHAFFIEAFIADLMLAARGMSKKYGSPEYDIRVGVEWESSEPLRLYRPHEIGEFDPLPVTKFVPVEATVDLSDDGAFFDNAEAIAEDCLNQAGIRVLKIIPRGRDRFEEVFRIFPLGVTSDV
ncbi:helix-turn-helix domain-containing protein [uncultured Corynebacterium sp.]|uniref:AlbA family DNA-binding domain-containing protein n=1 Tax=uncultured Corynebacterium sp. TaxID=159447 RepID=UPI0025D3E6CA|nr:ATP-binding protein [uncultured Corynebacterium sp.]